MPRRLLGGAILLVAIARAAAAVAVQVPVSQSVVGARRLIQARNLDSARTLLRQVVAAPRDRAPAVLVEAWMLLAIVEFYQGRDSAAALAFHEVFALDPQAQGHLPDPELQQMFDSLRPAQIDLPPATAVLSPTAGDARRQDAPSGGTLYRCVPRCDPGVRRPVLLQMRPLSQQDLPARFGLGPEGVRGYVVIRGVVGEGGHLEPGSLQVVASTSRTVSARDVEGALLDAQFTPGELRGMPVRVLVEFRYECRLEGLNMISCGIRGP